METAVPKLTPVEVGCLMSAEGLRLVPFQRDKTDSSSDQEVEFSNSFNKEVLKSIETLTVNIRCVNQNLLMLSC